MDRRKFIGAAASAAVMVPMAAVAMPVASASVAATGPDAAIHSAWARRVAAHRMIASQGMDASDRSADPHWAVIDECDKFIQSATAKTPRGVETQIWVALHNSSAYLAVEEEALLNMDLVYVEAHASQFDWAALPMVSALRSLRAMGDA